MKEGNLHDHVRVRAHVRVHVHHGHFDDCSRVRVRGRGHDRGHDCKDHALNRSNPATAVVGECDDLCGLSGNVRVHHY